MNGPTNPANLSAIAHRIYDRLSTVRARDPATIDQAVGLALTGSEIRAWAGGYLQNYYGRGQAVGLRRLAQALDRHADKIERESE